MKFKNKLIKSLPLKSLFIYLLLSYILLSVNSKISTKSSNLNSNKSNLFSKKKFIKVPTKPISPDSVGCVGERKEKVILKKPTKKIFGNDNDTSSNEKKKAKKETLNSESESESGTIPKFQANWFDTNLKGKDIGVNSQGDIFIVGADSKLYEYEFATNSFIHIEGDFELTKIFRVDVAWDGIPYVITETGDTYYLSCDHKWMRLSGCASDIGTGRGGEVFKTGCDEREKGYGVYKLFCSTSVTCDYRGCLNFRKKANYFFTHKESGRTCEWFRIDGNGVKIDVAPNGNPYVIDKHGEINLFDGINWRKVSTKVKGYDITLSNEGVLFYIGQDANIYKSVNEIEGKWLQLEGQGIAISSGPFGQPWIVSRENFHVKGTAKFGYN